MSEQRERRGIDIGDVEYNHACVSARLRWGLLVVITRSGVSFVDPLHLFEPSSSSL